MAFITLNVQTDMGVQVPSAICGFPIYVLLSNKLGPQGPTATAVGHCLQHPAIKQLVVSSHTFSFLILSTMTS